MFRELTPPKKYAALAQEDDAILVDCRSPAEWHFTGMPDLSGIGKKVVLAAVADESGRPNPQFVDEAKVAIAAPSSATDPQKMKSRLKSSDLDRSCAIPPIARPPAPFAAAASGQSWSGLYRRTSGPPCVWTSTW